MDKVNLICIVDIMGMVANVNMVEVVNLVNMQKLLPETSGWTNCLGKPDRYSRHGGQLGYGKNFSMVESIIMVNMQKTFGCLKGLPDTLGGLGRQGGHVELCGRHAMYADSGASTPIGYFKSFQ